MGGSPDRRLLPPPPPQSSKMVPNSRAAAAGGRDAPMPRNRDPLGGRARVDHAARRSAGDPQCDAGAAQPWPRGAKPREESYGHLPNPRATRHQRRRRPAAGPPFRRARPRPPCSAPLWCARRISSPEALVGSGEGSPGEEEVVGGETKRRRRRPLGQGRRAKLPTQMRWGRRDTGGVCTRFIPDPAVTPR